MSQVAESGLRQEFGIRKVGPGELPFSVSDWTERDANDAAKYNSERWGPYEVVARWVSDWEAT